MIYSSPRELGLGNSIHGICEGLWIERMLEELKIRAHQPMQLLSDNKAPLEISANLAQHDRTKHFEVDRHFIKEKIKNGVLDISYIPTKKQVVDVTPHPPNHTIEHDRVKGALLLDLFCKRTQKYRQI